METPWAAPRFNASRRKQTAIAAMQSDRFLTHTDLLICPTPDDKDATACRDRQCRHDNYNAGLGITMNTKRTYAVITACVAVLGGQGTAHAAGIELAAFGSFQNIVAGPKTSWWLQNNDEVTDAVLLWGDVGCPQCDLTSRLIFDGLGSTYKPTFASLPVGTAFQLSYFSFLKGTPGHRRTNVSALDLSLSLHTTEGAIGDFVFGVTIDNTHDKQKKGNAGHLKLVYDLGPHSFSYAGQLYSLDFLGLSTDEGKSFTDSLTVPENEKLASGLFATITAKATPPTEPVPVPAAAWLLGSGLLGLVGLGRRR